MTRVLGINDSHLATACLLEDGRIVACASEERFSRRKNDRGLPRRSIQYCLREGRIRGSEVDLAVLATKTVVMQQEMQNPLGFKMFYGLLTAASRMISPARELWVHSYDALIPHLSAKTRYARRQQLADSLGIPVSKVVTMNHHLAHAYAGAFSSGFDEALVLTNDGLGDLDCATVSLKSGNNISVKSRTHYTNSIGYLYYGITRYLGLKGLEDEYKVMGLAAYAKDPTKSKTYRRLEQQFSIDEHLRFRARRTVRDYDALIGEACIHVRFDQVAGALQLVTEKALTKWARKAIDQTGQRDVVLSGGTFMNVKANMSIASLQQLKRVFVMPSCGDESNAIGAAIWGYLALKPTARIQPMKDLYFGPAFGKEETQQAVETARRDCEVEELAKVDEAIGEDVARGEIVARFSGRMEFGARALGNRSILARADDLRAITTLNSQVKSRDFWMPFAPTILADSAERFLSAPQVEKTDPEYMVIAFHGSELARTELRAASHSYDNTVRPQVLREGWNQGYAKLIERYGERTGTRAILNTSFNLHGEPIVCTPSDAVGTLMRSGLENLALGNFILHKK